MAICELHRENVPYVLALMLDDIHLLLSVLIQVDHSKCNCVGGTLSTTQGDLDRDRRTIEVRAPLDQGVTHRQMPKDEIHHLPIALGVLQCLGCQIKCQ